MSRSYRLPPLLPSAFMACSGTALPYLPDYKARTTQKTEIVEIFIFVSSVTTQNLAFIKYINFFFRN
jgi:hypothetical protein